MAKLKRLVYAMTMNGLETTASVTLSISLIPFLSAWDAQGEGPRKYRRTVKKFLYFGMALVTIPLGFAAGIAMLALAPFDPRPLGNAASLKCYQYRRRYQGRHYSGVGVARTLRAAAREPICNALAS